MWRKWEKTSRSQLIRLISSEGDVIYTVYAIQLEITTRIKENFIDCDPKYYSSHR